MNNFAADVYEHLSDSSLSDALQAIANQGTVMKTTINMDDWTVKGYLNGNSGNESAVVSYKGVEVADIGFEPSKTVASVYTPYPEISAPICDAVQKAIGVETIDKTQEEIDLAADVQGNYKMYISQTGRLKMTEVSKMTEHSPSGEKLIQHGEKPSNRTCIMEVKDGKVEIMPGFEDVRDAINDTAAGRNLQRSVQAVEAPTIPPVAVSVFYTQEAGDKQNILPGHDTHIRVPDFKIEAGQFTELRSDSPKMRLIPDKQGTCTLYTQDQTGGVKRIPFVSAEEAVKYMTEETHVVTTGPKIGDIIGVDKDGKETDLTVAHRESYYIRQIEKPEATRIAAGQEIPASGKLDPEPNKEKPADKLSMFVHGDILHKVMLESMDSNGYSFDIPYEANIKPNGLLDQMTIQESGKPIATVDIARVPVAKDNGSYSTNGTGVIQIKAIKFEPGVDNATQRKMTTEIVDSIAMHNQTRYQVPVEETIEQAGKHVPQLNKPSKNQNHQQTGPTM